jgi:hypothetical protein
MSVTGKKLLWIVAGSAAVVYASKRAVTALNRNGRLTRLFGDTAEKIDRAVGWNRLPVWLSAITLTGLRHVLRRENLHDTAPPRAHETAVPPPHARHRTVRTVDGTYNDLEHPCMGSAGMRFGRNVPIPQTHPEKEDRLLSPSPRTVSLDLMTRHTFQPAVTLNVLAAAWLQFMVRDWFSHGKSEKENPWLIPLPLGDDWHENPMRILRVPRATKHSPAEDRLPPTYVNTETHWWDASQLYGSNAEFQQKIRLGTDGKVRLNRQNVVEVDTQGLVQQANLAGWWVGLGLMFTVFAQEHNAICDRLKKEYAAWDDEMLFQHARLINAALLAKIHTVEWTTAILGHPVLQIAMRTNWWGILGERIHELLGRVSKSEIISGIPGSDTNHFGVPYSITEEFVAVYRMHPLIPDDYQFRSVKNDAVLGELKFPELAGHFANGVIERFGMTDLLYSFGLAHPGAVVLHNFPRSLQEFKRPDGIVVDLAAHDILRSRELGVPRYNQFRRVLHLRPFSSFEEMTANPEWAKEIRHVYDNDIERVDLTVGLFAERLPAGFGFSDTAFRIFILMASRRLNSDRFFTKDFTPEVYTPVGMKWLEANTMSTVLLRHFPDLAPALRGVENAFAPWSSVTGREEYARKEMAL